jgi:hypothetical protein
MPSAPARSWLDAYLHANRAAMTPRQIKTLCTIRRDPATATMTVGDLAAAMRTTIDDPAGKPIRQIGPITAEYMLTILP